VLDVASQHEVHVLPLSSRAVHYVTIGSDTNGITMSASGIASSSPESGRFEGAISAVAYDCGKDCRESCFL
jgi:hypothetical protein